VKTSWITFYPQWYVSERSLIARKYPGFRVDEGRLANGILCYYGDLTVRPSGGAKRHPVCIVYPTATPFELPIVTPIKSLPQFADDATVKSPPEVEYFDRRHQMPAGSLCLFQRETRADQGGEWVQVTDVLRRAERWFLGLHTGHWPPDSYESELEAHFVRAGDVLVSRTFFSPQLTGRGEFVMVRDMRRIVDRATHEDPPLIVTAVTQTTNGIVAVFDAREDIERVYPWIENEAWSPARLAELDARKDDENWNFVTEHGYWWSLPKEPQPFRNGAGLLGELGCVAPNGDAWQMLDDTLGSELTTFEEHFFGLRYPGRSRGSEWLILHMRQQNKSLAGGGLLLRSAQEKRRLFERTPISCYRAHAARTEEIQLRNTGVVETTVRKKTVALIGVGALGSKVAELLAQAGVGTFCLCDPDRLAVGNVARHIGGVADFGMFKTDVVARRLVQINPYLRIGLLLDDSAVSSLDKLAEFLGAADITVCTTADENVESAINQVAVLHGKTVLYGRALRRGSMGRVFLVRPERDPCKACLGIYARDSRTAQPAPQDWVEVTERDEDILLHECGRPVIPASAVDLSFIAALISRIALDCLEEKEAPANHWLWSSVPAPDVDPRFAEPVSTLALSLPRHDHCTVCQRPEVASVFITEKARDAILAEVQSSLAAETGGILLGYIDGNRTAVVLRATGPGPNAQKSASGFDRDVEFVQAELDSASRELGPQGLYIGEWHSHLEKAPEPSPRDVMSMCGIAEAPNYATRCPVLIIAGLDPQLAKVSTIKTWAFPVGGRIHAIEHQVLPAAAIPEA
jgi:integrative and conjugative element protein (TIGR02256 family)